MLKAVRTKSVQAGGARFVIVASRYNARYVDSMVRAAKAKLNTAGAKHIRIVRVPGAFEIPVVAARLARTASALRGNSVRDVTAIICLGVILRGATSHAEHIGKAVSEALMRIQLEYDVPVIHEVLLLENEQQAKERCLGAKHNRGREAAQTALEMTRIMREIA